jgi:hypothetical protein
VLIRAWTLSVPALNECRRRQHLDAHTYLCRKVLQVAGDQQRGRQRPCYQGQALNEQVVQQVRYGFRVKAKAWSGQQEGRARLPSFQVGLRKPKRIIWPACFNSTFKSPDAAACISTARCPHTGLRKPEYLPIQRSQSQAMMKGLLTVPSHQPRADLPCHRLD